MDLVRGFILGFSIAAVLGPIGVLCIRRTLERGFVLGFLSGLGAATADATYAAVAAFGVSALATVLVDQGLWLRLVGGAFLVSLGLRTLRSARRPAPRAADVSAAGLAGAYASTLLLTLSNPMTILSFVGILAGLGVGSFGVPGSGAWVVAGVFLGSTAWWLVLASVVARVRERLSARVFGLVNIGSGLLIVGFGLQALASLRSVGP